MAWQKLTDNTLKAVNKEHIRTKFNLCTEQNRMGNIYLHAEKYFLAATDNKQYNTHLGDMNIMKCHFKRTSLLISAGL